ncbi:MAG TPA: SapC family protein [Lysobacter sp.]
MPNHVLLNNIDHKGLRIDTGHGAALGDDVMFTVTFPAEFRNVQAHYPIVFHKDAQGELQPVVLFGFHQGGGEQGSNLFLDGGRWDATYVPLAIERQPFLIGRDGQELMVHIDLDHPRVRSDHGETLFRDQGGTTDFLDRITSVLMTLHEGLAATPAFMQALLRHDLIESFTLDVELDGGSLNRLVGFYTINEERLRALDAAALDELHRAGHLEAVYMVVASVSRFRDLIARMNRRHAAGH